MIKRRKSLQNVLKRKATRQIIFRIMSELQNHKKIRKKIRKKNDQLLRSLVIAPKMWRLFHIGRVYFYDIRSINDRVEVLNTVIKVVFPYVQKIYGLNFRFGYTYDVKPVFYLRWENLPENNIELETTSEYNDLD